MTMEMEYREYCDQIAFLREENAVREITNQGTPNIFFDNRELKRILDESGEHRVDLRFEDLEFGFGRDIKPPHLADGSETFQQLFADVGPSPRCHFSAAVGCKPFRNDVTMPVWDWNILRTLGEVVPERLDVLELFVR
jgi:hypothetical protein